MTFEHAIILFGFIKINFFVHGRKSKSKNHYCLSFFDLHESHTPFKHILKIIIYLFFFFFFQKSLYNARFFH